MDRQLAMQEEGSSSVLALGSMLAGTQSEEAIDFLVRRSDSDDYDVLKKLVTEDMEDIQNLLFDYPKILHLIETSFIAVTILDRNQKIVGCATFNDSPQGLRGKHDFKHENLWEEWLPRACNLLDKHITPRNSLWLTYLLISQDYRREEKAVLERVLQNVYNYQSAFEYVLFLKRGEACKSEAAARAVGPLLSSFFIEIEVLNRDVLKELVGVSVDSEFLYMHKSTVIEPMEIRMAREEDHDDLAEIFNKQSGVLTSQYGEFFIADLIATQNLTRRLTKGTEADGMAIVGQVRDKAVGLMSVSTEIDYRLLSSCFELDLYDNLLKQDFMDAVRVRTEQVEAERRAEEEQVRRAKLEQLRIEQHKCRIIGQRLCLQQYCIDKEIEIKLQIDTLKMNEEQMKQLSQEAVADMIKRWMKDFALNIPSTIFREFPDFDPELETFILSPSDFFLETLEYFGLPRNYMYGEGHWKDWAKKILEERKNTALRRPTKKKKQISKTKKKEDKKEDEELKPPSYFDITPFDVAFKKFTEVGPDIRTGFRLELERLRKKALMLFCDEDGCMIQDYTVDLLTLGKKLSSCGLTIPTQVADNMVHLLQAFGGISYRESVIQVQVKEEEERKVGGKNIYNKKDPNEPAKMMDLQLKLTNWVEFDRALQTITDYDITLFKLGRIKSAAIAKELAEKEEVEQQLRKTEEEQSPRSSSKPSTQRYVKEIGNLVPGELPEFVPSSAHNAFVIILFCIDEVFQNRSVDFLPYAFSLFPDRDYVILTQPFSVPESTLLQNFIQVPHKKNSTFQHTLYIFHRDSLLGNELRVRRAEMRDLELGAGLLQGLQRRENILAEVQDSIKNVQSKRVTFSVHCEDVIVGMFVVSKGVNIDYYVSHFNLKDHLIIAEHPRHRHSKVVHAILNPLFSKFTRFILREIMRLMGKTNLYFEVHERTLLPTIFDELIFIKAMTFPKLLRRKWDFEFEEADLERRVSTQHVVDGQRDPFDQDDAPFSLSFVSKKYLSSNKVSNNTRIVVVGASDTGLSFIESLLMLKDIDFTNITLLAPGGLLTMHINDEADLLRAMSTNYTLEELRSLMIDARVTVLDAKMIKLDKKAKRILLDKNAYLPFDILVIAVGLIDTQIQTLGLVSAGLTRSPHYREKKHIVGVYSIDDPYLYQQFQRNKGPKSNLFLLTRRKKPQKITVYGRTPHVVVFISGLVNRGVDPKRITLVIPQPTREVKRSFSSNQERLQYEDKVIIDPDMFEDPALEKLVMEEMVKMGVVIHQGFNYYRIETEDNICRQILFRKKADNYDELQKKINEKRNEIKLRQEELGNNKGFDNEEDEQNQNENSPEKEIELLMQQQWHEISSESRFFVTSGLIDIDLQIFHIIHENGLVYNGRLIVKSNFQTTENEVFACGKICEFSQRYKKNSIGKSLRLDKYNGRELGVKLSKHVLEMLDLSHLTTENYSVEELPKLYFPVGLGGCLPGGVVFYHIKKIDWAQHKSVFLREKEQGLQKREIALNNIVGLQGHYMRFVLDHNDMIESVTYLGSEKVQVPSILIFVGMSIKYLNKLTSRFESGLIPNLAEFLSENWALAIYHNYFDGFRAYMKEEILMGQSCERILIRAAEHAKEGNFLTRHFFEEVKSMVPGDVFESIRDGMIEFLAQNKNQLPMYFLPEQRVQIFAFDP